MSYRNALSDTINPYRLEEPQNMLLVFADLPRSCGRFYGLKRGFGHCFMLLQFADGVWWVIDPLFCGIVHARLHIDNMSAEDETGSIEEIRGGLENNGCHVVAMDYAHIRHCMRRHARFYHFGLPRLGLQGAMLSFGVFSCVTLIKRCLGIRRPWIITPHQLYQFLIEQKVKK